MRIVHLRKDQNDTVWVTSPIFEHVQVISDVQNAELLKQYCSSPSQEMRDTIFFSNLHLVRHTVGRYLAHWPETKRFEEDMISVGVETLLQTIDKAKPSNFDIFRPYAVMWIKGSIEDYLNRNQSTVAASRSTNFRRVRAGEPIASKNDAPLTSIGE